MSSGSRRFTSLPVDAASRSDAVVHRATDAESASDAIRVLSGPVRCDVNLPRLNEHLMAC